MTRGTPAVPFAEPADTRQQAAQFAADVRYYLTQSPKQLPSRYLYDALGSALFEAICHLPWYGITRAESRLLVAHAAEMFRRLPSLSTIVELGPGSGEKLRALLEGTGRERAPLDVHLVDVSRSALDASMQAVGSLDDVRVVAHAASYEAGLEEAAGQANRPGRTLVVFLGSNIGNFDPPAAAALIRSMRLNLAEGDAVLIGADLVKPAPELRLAYDDPLGVTAAFNRNLLVRINRELHGDFDIEQFRHEAVWNADASRIEMHLVARRAQRVRIPDAHVDITLEDGERIWTESSYKYRPGDIPQLLADAGFGRPTQWIDAHHSFALTLAEAR